MPRTSRPTCRPLSPRPLEIPPRRDFPLALLRGLRESGYHAEHLITLGQRGLPDSAIRQRLEREADLVLMTQDSDFEDLDFPCLGIVIVSHVRQSLRISARIAVWLRAVATLAEQPADVRLFDLWEPGALAPVRVERIERPAGDSPQEDD